MSQNPHPHLFSGLAPPFDENTLEFSVNNPGPPWEPQHLPNPTVNAIPLGPVIPAQVLELTLNPLFTEVQNITQSLSALTQTVNNVNNRLSAIELALQIDRGAEGDDEAESIAHSSGKRAVKRARTSGASKAAKGPPKPDSGVLHLMQDVVRRILYSGCQVTKMEELKEGLTDDELRKRITENPQLPWRPDFLVAADHERNKFWVDKILEESLKDADAQGKLGDAQGCIPAQFWNRDCIFEHVLKGMWDSARKGVKRATDPEARARAARLAKKAKQDARRQRLYARRLDLATGDTNHPPFQYTVGSQTRTIPTVLITEDITSDVISDEHDVDGIRPDTSLEDYREARQSFNYEGVPPFFRHKMWNDIFKAMDQQIGKSRGQPLQARYYASKENRGQRKASPNKVDDIPTGGLYRCHIEKVWYNRLPEWKRKAIKPSPKGWEVDEELEQMGDSYAEE